MRQTTSTISTMTRTPTRASCTCEHALRARSLRLSFDVCVTCTSWLKVFLSLISSTFIVIHERFSLSSFSTLYFDLSFTIIFHFFLLTHLEQHTELDNLITMQNLRNSANKGVTTPTTSTPPSHFQGTERLRSKGGKTTQRYHLRNKTGS